MSETRRMSDQLSTQTRQRGALADRPPRTQKVGKVVSDKMDKTVVVAVTTFAGTRSTTSG